MVTLGGLERLPNSQLHGFGLCGEAKVSGEDPHGHGEKIQTPHWVDRWIISTHVDPTTVYNLVWKSMLL